MRIARFQIGNTVSFGIIEGDTITAIEAAPWQSTETTGPAYPLAEVKLLAPVQPPDVFAIGLNYKSHADEFEAEYPPAPIIFLKATSTVIGPGDAIVLPKMAPNEVDYEAELVIVIGKTCRNVSREDALGYALGYTVGNDVSARDCQLREDTQWARGKSFDTFCPLGPWIETDIDAENVSVKSVLNGEVMQDSSTSMLIFPCAELISYISRIATLRPGTVIMTGTPSGVGFKRQPPVFLRPGDTIEMTVGGIGMLSNPVVAEA